MAREYSVFGVIIRDEQVLMVLNPEKMIARSGKVDLKRAVFVKERGWGCPGGGVDKGETILQSIAREVEEETGVRIFVNERTPFLETSSQDGHARIFYLIENFEGEAHPNSSEVEDVAWIPLAIILEESREVQYHDTSIYRGHRRYICELLKILNNV